jgi:hypothetical protein
MHLDRPELVAAFEFLEWTNVDQLWPSISVPAINPCSPCPSPPRRSGTCKRADLHGQAPAMCSGQLASWSTSSDRGSATLTAICLDFSRMERSIADGNSSTPVVISMKHSNFRRHRTARPSHRALPHRRSHSSAGAGHVVRLLAGERARALPSWLCHPSAR